MYCKNCGRLLKEGARFCDRCGQSVRQNKQPSERETKRREIENLKEERLNRQKRIAYKEARESQKKKQKKSRRKRNIVLICIFAVMLLALISAVVSYQMNSSDDASQWGGTTIETAAPATLTPTMAVSTMTPQNQPVSVGSNDTPVINTADYELFKINNTTCPYPKGFITKPASGNARLSLADNSGGASMTVSIENNVATPTTDLMRNYASQVGGEVIDSRASSKTFVVTAERDNIIYHRKCMVDGNDIIYYDFQYSVGSAKASQYRENIAYMDSVMDGTVNED